MQLMALNMVVQRKKKTLTLPLPYLPVDDKFHQPVLGNNHQVIFNTCEMLHFCTYVSNTLV